MSGEANTDIFVIGGGVNGCGIARDAAGRGLTVTLAEADDLASGTSSASTKLFHGGLRYLEFFEFGLVRQALAERETLLRAMPHIARPMRFVLPLDPSLRVDADTPASRLTAAFMPWTRGRRPVWALRLGLFMYDHMGGRHLLPGTRRLDLRADPAGAPLNDRYRTAFEYSDCWVDDARLVTLNARDAADRGATIMTRHRVTAASRTNGLWHVEVKDTTTGKSRMWRARTLINAAGPWIDGVIGSVLRHRPDRPTRLVRGSHIVTRRLFDHDRAYFLQGEDGRIVFAIPYESEFTLIGTTDIDHEGDPRDARCSAAERDYLCAFVSRYFGRRVTAGDVVWSFAGVRALRDDGGGSATAATRDYTLELDSDGAPLLNVFGGKITTHRRLAEAALARLRRAFPEMGPAWTAGAPLPGGDFRVDGADALVLRLRQGFPFLDAAWATRLVRAYGTDAFALLDGATCKGDLGRDFGATLSEREVHWLTTREFAQTAEDVVWRRTKLGLRLSAEELAALDAFMSGRSARRQPVPAA